MRKRGAEAATTQMGRMGAEDPPMAPAETLSSNRLPSMEQRPATPAPYTTPPAYAPQATGRYNPWAIVSVSFAGSTVLGSWCFGGLIAVITGHVARHQIKTSGEAGANLALIGLVVGYVSIGLFLLFIAAYIAFVVFVLVLAATHPNSSPSPTASP